MDKAPGDVLVEHIIDSQRTRRPHISVWPRVIFSGLDRHHLLPQKLNEVWTEANAELRRLHISWILRDGGCLTGSPQSSAGSLRSKNFSNDCDESNQSPILNEPLLPGDKNWLKKFFVWNLMITTVMTETKAQNLMGKYLNALFRACLKWEMHVSNSRSPDAPTAFTVTRAARHLYLMPSVDLFW